jgi:integrase
MLPEDPPSQRFLTPEEYQAVLKVATGEIRDVIRLLAHTGLRVSELTGLTQASISPDGSLLTVVGKGRKRRYIPLDITCREILDPRRIKKGPVFEWCDTRYSRPRQSILDRCYLLADLAGIPRFGLRDEYLHGWPHAIEVSVRRMQ